MNSNHVISIMADGSTSTKISKLIFQSIHTILMTVIYKYLVMGLLLVHLYQWQVLVFNIYQQYMILYWMGCVWIMVILKWIWWQVRFYIMSWVLLIYTSKKMYIINYRCSSKKNNDDTAMVRNIMTTTITTITTTTMMHQMKITNRLVYDNTIEVIKT